jgi:hypothetical protein
MAAAASGAFGIVPFFATSHRDKLLDGLFVMNPSFRHS